MIERLVLGYGIERRDIVLMTVAGNAVMHHLFFGLDVKALGGFPFRPVVNQLLVVPAAELALELAPATPVVGLPLISGYIGADTVGVTVALDLLGRKDTAIAVDVGTNAEVALVHQGRLYVCSAPAGPAFEGAQMACGTQARPGAITKVVFDERRQLLEVYTVEEKPPFGIAGTGIIDTVAELARVGVHPLLGAMDAALGTLEDSTILVEDDRIAAVGAVPEAKADAEIDARGMIALPGLVNAHLHTFQSALRGIGTDWTAPQYFRHQAGDRRERQRVLVVADDSKRLLGVDERAVLAQHRVLGLENVLDAKRPGRVGAEPRVRLKVRIKELRVVADELVFRVAEYPFHGAVARQDGAPLSVDDVNGVVEAGERFLQKVLRFADVFLRLCALGDVEHGALET